MRIGAPFSSNSRQCGQVKAPISISFTLALGLPIMKPAEVAFTTSVQSPPGGGVACVIVTFSLVAVVLAVFCLLQAASARTATAQARTLRTFIDFNRSG